MDGARSTERTRTSATHLTYDDFLLLPDDGQRHELIDGKHYVTPSPNLRHQRVSVRIVEAFLRHLEEHPGGELFHPPFDCVLTNDNVVEPDLIFVAGDQLDILTEKHIRGAPALLIEILSPSTRAVDTRIKRDLYDRAGVREYWIVDPEGDTITVYRRAASGAFPRAAQLSAAGNDTLTTPLLPGFNLPLPGCLGR